MSLWNRSLKVPKVLIVKDIFNAAFKDLSIYLFVCMNTHVYMHMHTSVQRGQRSHWTASSNTCHRFLWARASPSEPKAHVCLARLEASKCQHSSCPLPLELGLKECTRCPTSYMSIEIQILVLMIVKQTSLSYLSIPTFNIFTYMQLSTGVHMHVL